MWTVETRPHDGPSLPMPTLPWCPRLRLFNLRQDLWEILPMSHHHLRPILLEQVGHLLLLRLTFVAARVRDHRDAGADRAQGSALAVLDRHTLSGLLPQHFARMEIDGRIRLGRRDR